MVSLPKAWWGAAAAEDNELYLPRINGDHRVVRVIAVDPRQVLEAELVVRVAAAPHQAFSSETMYGRDFPMHRCRDR